MNNQIYILGNDISYHQRIYNPEKNKKADIDFLIMRATYGKYQNHDSKFNDFYTRASEANYPYGISAYHFFKPGHDINEQMEWFQAQMEDKPTPNIKTLPGVVFLDCEHSDGMQPDYISSVLRTACEYVKKHITSGLYPGIYTSQGWWNHNVLPSSYWSQLPLWVANWTTANQPYLPRDWINWDIWQYTVLKTKGYLYGFGSQGIDMNRILKTTEPPPVPPPPEEFPKTMVVTINFHNYEYRGVVKRGE